MGNTIRTLTAAVVLPGPAPAAAAETVHLMAVRGPRGQFWRVTVHLHVQQYRGHDRAFASGWVGTGGHVWLERQHAGRARPGPHHREGRRSDLPELVYHAVYDGPGASLH